MDMYSLPEYDITTDSFKDGPLPKNVDAYFSKPLDKRKNYSWIIANKIKWREKCEPPFNI